MRLATLMIASLSNIKAPSTERSASTLFGGMRKFSLEVLGIVIPLYQSKTEDGNPELCRCYAQISHTIDKKIKRVYDIRLLGSSGQKIKEQKQEGRRMKALVTAICSKKNKSSIINPCIVSLVACFLGSMYLYAGLSPYNENSQLIWLGGTLIIAAALIGWKTAMKLAE